MVLVVLFREELIAKRLASAKQRFEQKRRGAWR
jgi:hypothetical protein